MPHIKQLQHLGNSRAVILDKVLMHQVDIDPDGEVEIAVRDGAIVIRPHRYATDDEARDAIREIVGTRRRMLERLAK